MVELRQTEAVGTFDDQSVTVRDVDARLNDGGANEYIVIAGDELRHDLFELPLFHLPAADGNFQFWVHLFDFPCHAFDRCDAVVQIEDLAAPVCLGLNRALDQTFVVATHHRFDRAAIHGRGFNHAHGAGPGHGEIECPGNGCGAQGEDVDIGP